MNILPIIESISVCDIKSWDEIPISNYKFKNNFRIDCEFYVSFKNSIGSDRLSCIFRTEQLVIDAAINDVDIFPDGKGLFTLPILTKESIEDYLNNILQKCEGKNWAECMDKLSEYFLSEYD
jgi:hypothetical protein